MTSRLFRWCLVLFALTACGGAPTGPSPASSIPIPAPISSPSIASPDASEAVATACRIIDAAEPIDDAVLALLPAILEEDESLIRSALDNLGTAARSFLSAYNSGASGLPREVQAGFEFEANEIEPALQVVSQWALSGAGDQDGVAETGVTDLAHVQADLEARLEDTLPLGVDCP